MEQSQYLLYKPLPFYPFTNLNLLLTSSLETSVTGNSDLAYNMPFSNTMKLEHFPVSKQWNACKLPGLGVTGNSTNFMPSFVLQDHRIQPAWNRTQLFPTASESDESVLRRSCTLESISLTRKWEDNEVVKTSDACDEKKVSKIWRPFSPDLDTIPSSNNNTVNASSVEQNRTVRAASACSPFPTILPSSVKLGESSAFKAVKRKKYQCQYCDQWYLNSGQLAGHIRAHIGSKPFRCEYHGCSRAFARNEELTRHRRIHSGVKPHECDTCQKKFGRKDHLNKHKKTHMKASEKKIYLCEVPGCKHRYTRSDALTRHLSTAHSIKHQRSNSGRCAQSLVLLSNTRDSEMAGNCSR